MIMSDADTINTLHQVHGLLMWIAIGLLCPIGIIIANDKLLLLSNQLTTSWYTVHAMIQRLVIILMLSVCAFFITITFTSMDNVAHFSKIHTIARLLLFILMLFQGMNGILRPAAPK
eukprot:UN06863